MEKKGQTKGNKWAAGHNIKPCRKTRGEGQEKIVKFGEDKNEQKV